MKRLTTVAITAVAVAGLTGLAGAQAADNDREGKLDRIPEFEVDPSWPKELPNNWLIGQVGGIAVDRHDNIWILQRARTLTDDEAGAPMPTSTRSRGDGDPPTRRRGRADQCARALRGRSGRSRTAACPRRR